MSHLCLTEMWSPSMKCFIIICWKILKKKEEEKQGIQLQVVLFSDFSEPKKPKGIKVYNQITIWQSRGRIIRGSILNLVPILDLLIFFYIKNLICVGISRLKRETLRKFVKINNDKKNKKLSASELQETTLLTLFRLSELRVNNAT